MNQMLDITDKRHRFDAPTVNGLHPNIPGEYRAAAACIPLCHKAASSFNILPQEHFLQLCKGCTSCRLTGELC